MNKSFFQAFAAIICLLTLSCNSTVHSDEVKDNQDTLVSNESKLSSIKNSPSGMYVDDGFDKRNEGYDWVTIEVSETSNNEISIKIRSRADKKKPTCTADFIAVKVGDQLYESSYENKPLRFQFSQEEITISVTRTEDEYLLSYFCSGGYSIEGPFKKLSEGANLSQVEEKIFEKTLSLQGITFAIKSVSVNGQTQVEIKPSGLKISNDPILQTIKGKIVDAEIEDMNADGFPELLIYTETLDNNRRGDVLAVSVNGGKSSSLVYFPPIEENPNYFSGYQGKDVFQLVERSLVRRFPIFKDGKESGTVRDIVYRLEEGEASRKLTPVKSSEY